MTNVRFESFNQYLKDQLKDPKFKKIWDAGEAQYQAGRGIIRARIANKISQRELAKKAKTTQTVISRIENMTVNPTINLLQKIATALDRKLEIKFA